jgi:hypothetical protein
MSRPTAKACWGPSALKGIFFRLRHLRERNEEMILNLVEQVIERLKKDASENDF